MSVVAVHNVKKFFGDELILDDVSLQLHPRERVGLVGPNGAGKTTLLNIIAGEITADQGTIALVRGASLGYLKQGAGSSAAGTMESVLRSAFAEIDALAAQLKLLEQKMAKRSQYTEQQLAEIMHTYGELQHRFEAAGGYLMEARLRAVVNGLGFTMDDLPRALATFSGGEQTRIRLARLLLARPDVLLLDEPTNHLDLASVEWLEKFLTDWPGSILIVSHDRYFLDRVATRIVALEQGTLKSYPGNYSAYQKQREQERITQAKAYAKQQEYIAKETAYIRSLGTGEREKRQAKSRQKRLAKLQLLAKPQETKAMGLDFGFSGRSGEIAVRMEGVAKSFSVQTVFSEVNFVLRWGDRVALVGPNGAGKTTLLKLITGELQPDAGRVWVGPSVRIVYFDQQQEIIDNEQTPLEEIMAASKMTITETRNYLGRFLFSGDDVFKRNADLSGGEKSRLALAKLSLDEGNFLLLDEPTNHLDIKGVEELEEAIHSFPGTLLVVSHDRYFISRTTSKILEVAEGRVTYYPVPYAEYVQEREKRAALEPNAEERKKVRRQAEQQRQREAEILRRRELRKLTLAIKETEKEIYLLEEKIAALEAELLEPHVFSDYQMAAEKGQELEEAKAGLQLLYEQWEQQTEQLENLTGETAAD